MTDVAPFDLAETQDEAKPKRGLRTQHLSVTLAGEDSPVQVTTANPDLVRWDITRAKHNWPDSQAAPMLWLTFVAWAALKRTHQTDTTFEAFRDHHCLNIDVEDQVEADPTKTAPGAV